MGEKDVKNLHKQHYTSRHTAKENYLLAQKLKLTKCFQLSVT